MLQTVITNIVTWLIARFNALKAKLVVLQTAINAEASTRQAADTALQTAINDEVAARQAGDQANAQAITAEAAARTALGVQLTSDLNAEGTARTTTDADLQAQINALGTASTTAINNAISVLKDSVVRGFTNYKFGTNESKTLAQLIAATGINIAEKGKYAIQLFGGVFDDEMTVTGLPNGSAVGTGAITHGDILFITSDGTNVTAVVKGDDVTKVKFAGIDSQLADLLSRIVALEAIVAGLDGDYATDVDVDDKILAAFTMFFNSLQNSGYTDPN